MFDDLSELEHVLTLFEAAKDWPDSWDLQKVGPIPYARRRLDEMLNRFDGVYGQKDCHEAELLIELGYMLSLIWTPSDLRHDWERVKELLLLSSQIEQEMDIEVISRQKNDLDKRVKNILPDALRGKKVLDSAKKGHETTHGSRREKEKRWAEYQKFIDVKHAEKPHLSLTACRKLAAKHLGVCLDTIKRHTKKSW